METLASLLELYSSLPEESTKERLENLENLKSLYGNVVRNLQDRNNELIIADSLQVQQIGLLLEQRYMLFNVLGDIKIAMDKEGRPDDPIVHMVFNVVETIKEMDNVWKEKVGDTHIKSKKNI